MFIRFKEDHETLTHKYTKGCLADLPKSEALKHVRYGRAFLVDHDKAVREYRGIERRGSAPALKTGKKTPAPKPPSKELEPDGATNDHAGDSDAG